MKKLFNNSFLIEFVMIAVIGTACLMSIYLTSMGATGTVFILILLAVCIVGTIFGPILALGISLLIIFFIGNLFFWTEFLQSPFQLAAIFPLNAFFFWSLSLTFLSLLTGEIHKRIDNLIEETRHMKEQFQQLVAIDPITGFDNKQRMLLELKEEISRAKRYNSHFSFLLIEIDYFHEFEKLYGEKETEHFLQMFANKLRTLLRESDQKYRVNKHTFAVLFPHTNQQQSNIITKKLKDPLSTHILLNGNVITLSIKFGHTVFEKTIADAKTLYENTKNELVTHV